jgi:hypothetical protein
MMISPEEGLIGGVALCIMCLLPLLIPKDKR